MWFINIPSRIIDASLLIVPDTRRVSVGSTPSCNVVCVLLWPSYVLTAPFSTIRRSHWWICKGQKESERFITHTRNIFLILVMIPISFMDFTPNSIDIIISGLKRQLILHIFRISTKTKQRYRKEWSNLQLHSLHLLTDSSHHSAKAINCKNTQFQYYSVLHRFRNDSQAAERLM